jgi:hypothetical protein
MAEHLVPVTGPKIFRFLRTELVNRWQVEPGSVASMDITRDTLIGFLQEHFGISRRRAGVEADEFLGAFQDKLRRATEGVTQNSFAAGTTLGSRCGSAA